MRIKIVFILSFFTFLWVSGQTAKELEATRKKITQEINKVERILFKKKKEKLNALDELNALEQKIEVRERLIKTILLESSSITQEIKLKEIEIETLKKQLASLKKEYGDMIYKSYKSKTQQNKLMFLLSSKNFNQAYKRLKYINQYAKFRERQGKEILTKRDDIISKTKKLKDQKNDKVRLLKNKKTEQNQIEEDKKLQKGLVQKIRREEGKYRRILSKKLREEKRIAKKMESVIRKEIAKSNKKEKKKSKVFLLNAERKQLATNFEKNRGKLPWPVDDGLVTRRFGVQSHPTLKRIKINSTGLHIETSKDNIAKSIFRGEVLAIQSVSEGRKSVMVQHGNYITAYNNLSDVFVRKGEKIDTGQRIGEIFTDKITGKTRLIFVLYKNLTRLDPEKWML